MFRALGFKVEIKSIEKLEDLKDLELKRKLNATREQIRDLNNKLIKGLITEEKYEKELTKREDLIDNLADKYEDIFSVYKVKDYRQPLRIDEIPSEAGKKIKQQVEKLFGKN